MWHVACPNSPLLALQLDVNLSIHLTTMRKRQNHHRDTGSEPRCLFEKTLYENNNKISLYLCNPPLVKWADTDSWKCS